MMYGNMAPVQSEVSVPYLQTNEEGVLEVELLAPSEPGTYQSHWRLAHHGTRFGHRVWSQIIVDEKIELEVTGETSSVNLNVVDDVVKEAEREEEDAEEPHFTNVEVIITFKMLSHFVFIFVT